MMRTTCAFTGHCPKKFPWCSDETARDCLELKKVLEAQIKKLADSGVTDYLTGMALGVDTWAALSVLALQEEKIPL